MRPNENPRPQNFQSALDQFRRDRNNPHLQSGYQDAVKQLQGIARGEDPENIQATYYPDWDLADVEELLAELGETIH